MIKRVEPLLTRGTERFYKFVSSHIRGQRFFRAQRNMFLWDVVFVEVNILCYTLAFVSFWRLIVISKREVLKTLYSILFTVAEVDSRTILYHFKEINWIGTHWRGTRRRSPVEGVKSVINFCCDSLILCFFFISVYQCCFLLSVSICFSVLSLSIPLLLMLLHELSKLINAFFK